MQLIGNTKTVTESWQKPSPKWLGSCK